MTKLFKVIVSRDNYNKYNDKYIRGDEKLWKIYIKK